MPENRITGQRLAELISLGIQDPYENDYLTDMDAALRELQDRRQRPGDAVTEANPDSLCPPHLGIAAKLKDISEPVYGCPQCAVNHITELEELIAEMYRYLPGLARLRFNDSEAGRIFERANIEEVQPVIDAIADLLPPRETTR